MSKSTTIELGGETYTVFHHLGMITRIERLSYRKQVLVIHLDSHIAKAVTAKFRDGGN